MSGFEVELVWREAEEVEEEEEEEVEERSGPSYSPGCTSCPLCYLRHPSLFDRAAGIPRVE